MADTICFDCTSEEYNHAMGAFLFATPEELSDFLFDHARYSLEHRISWHKEEKRALLPPIDERNEKRLSWFLRLVEVG